MRVAVLSKDYEPLTYCNVERAITLVYLNKAEAVRDSNLFVRSVSAIFRVPLVIRLLYKTARRFIPALKYSRKNIHVRDNYTCQYCGSTKNLSIDHLMPVSRGGKSTWENTVTACQKCNSKKGSKTPEEAGMKLARPAARPSIINNIQWNDFFSEDEL